MQQQFVWSAEDMAYFHGSNAIHQDRAKAIVNVVHDHVWAG